MALDKIHNAVKNALINDGWEITNENFQFQFKDLTLDGDFEAQKIGAENGIDKIFIKVTDFLYQSTMSDFEKTLGQLLLYNTVLAEAKPDVKTYLVFSENDHKRFLDSYAIRVFIEEEKPSFFVLNVENETITEWNN